MIYLLLSIITMLGYVSVCPATTVCATVADGQKATTAMCAQEQSVKKSDRHGKRCKNKRCKNAKYEWTPLDAKTVLANKELMVDLYENISGFKKIDEDDVCTINRVDRSKTAD